MKNSIFEYDDYKDFLRQRLRQRSTDLNERGTRSRLAEAANCHTAYVSQVLNGDSNFNLEQAERIGHFLGLNKDELASFYLLVQQNRAQSTTLKAHFREQRKILADKQLVLKDRLQFQRTLSREDQSVFYSSWQYGAVHVLISVPGCHSEQGIARYLDIPLSRVVEILAFLTTVGLVEKKHGSFIIGTTHIHLEHDSPMISKHHSNWRIRAIQSMDEVAAGDLHYSSVITCAEDDAPKIKAALTRAIEEVRAIVKPSKDECGFAYSIDFFSLKRLREST